MILIRYLLRSYGSYFIIGHCSLVFLYTAIEFFEKMSHVQHTSMSLILKFIALNSIPCFFSLFPLSSWLACCFFLKDFSDHARFNALQTLGISLKELQRVLIGIGVLLCVLCFVGKEFVAYSCALRSIRLNKEQFKKHNIYLIEHKWFRLDQNTFCHITQLDTKLLQGNDITLITRNSNHEVTNVTHANSCIIDPIHEQLIITKGFSINPLTGLTECFAERNIPISHLLRTLESLGLPLSYQRLISSVSTGSLSKNHMRAELTDLLTRTLLPLQIIVLIALSICMFLYFLTTTYLKWIMLLGLYPLFIFIVSMCSFLIDHGAPPVVMLLPYIASFGIVSLLNRITKAKALI